MTKTSNFAELFGNLATILVSAFMVLTTLYRTF
jgi:hypothetical protein